MVTELQFIAVAAFLIWGLASSLCGLLKPDADDAELVQHGRESRGAQQPHPLHEHRRTATGPRSRLNTRC